MIDGDESLEMASETVIEENGKAFEPKILAFTCNWCSYAGIDIAGVLHMQYPASLRIIKTMCIGRIHPDLILEAFARGADGVLIIGCQVGDCHYIRGNAYNESRMEEMIEMFASLGIDPRRLKVDFIYAYEGKKFSEIAREFVQNIKDLGPNSIRIST
jgi:coenzyme F420-reducing hydrogenase delta subunit